MSLQVFAGYSDATGHNCCSTISSHKIFLCTENRVHSYLLSTPYLCVLSLLSFVSLFVMTPHFYVRCLCTANLVKHDHNKHHQHQRSLCSSLWCSNAHKYLHVGYIPSHLHLTNMFTKELSTQRVVSPANIEGGAIVDLRLNICSRAP